jgi:hypothetical protein
MKRDKTLICGMFWAKIGLKKKVFQLYTQKSRGRSSRAVFSCGSVII